MKASSNAIGLHCSAREAVDAIKSGKLLASRELQRLCPGYLGIMMAIIRHIRQQDETMPSLHPIGVAGQLPAARR
jgi:hypothetical protein